MRFEIDGRSGRIDYINIDDHIIRGDQSIKQLGSERWKDWIHFNVNTSKMGFIFFSCENSTFGSKYEDFFGIIFDPNRTNLNIIYNYFKSDPWKVIEKCLPYFGSYLRDQKINQIL